MQNLTTIALQFITDCSDATLYTKNQDKFKQELKKVGELLIQRVKFEESQLYPLYKKRS